jgi:hypothetical protein
MWATLGDILPIAVAVAFSSVPIMAVILILLAPNNRRSSIAFLVGWAIGLAVVVVAFTLLAFLIDTPPPRRSQVAIGTLLILIGAAVVILAIVLWRRTSNKPNTDLPHWLSGVGRLRPWRAFGLALLLNIRPKAILLSAAAGLSIRGDHLPTAETAIVIVVYTVVSASAVAFPVISSLVAPTKTRAGLVSARSWIAENSRIVGVLILIIIGVVIIGNGLARL